MTEAGYAYIYTLPYWIFTDDTELWRGNQVEYNDYIYAIYPPHRNSDYPFLNTPTKIHFEQIPGLKTNENITVEPFNILLPDMGDPQKRLIIWPGGIDKLDPIKIPKDSVRIDILPKSKNKFQPDEAKRFLNNLMQLVRWKTKQWWITRSSYALSSSGAFPIVINTQRLPIKTTIRLLPVISTCGLFGDEAILTESLWIECSTQACLDDVNVPVYDFLLLEAKYFLGVKDIRQTILEASSAVDICKEITFQRLWCAKHPGKLYDESKRFDLLRNMNYPKHLDFKFQNHFHRSYKQEHPHEWTEIKNLYDTRNNIAHGGHNEYGAPPVVVDYDVCRKFVLAADHCVSWLLNL